MEGQLSTGPTRLVLWACVVLKLYCYEVGFPSAVWQTGWLDCLADCLSIMVTYGLVLCQTGLGAKYPTFYTSSRLGPTCNMVVGACPRCKHARTGHRKQGSSGSQLISFYTWDCLGLTCKTLSGDCNWGQGPHRRSTYCGQVIHNHQVPIPIAS